jgi:hypothetical protein
MLTPGVRCGTNLRGMRAAALFVAAALAAAVGAGCGGDEDAPSGTSTNRADAGVPAKAGSDREQIARTVRAYVQALNAGDGEQACALLTKNGKGVLAGLLPSNQSETECVDVIERLARRWTDLADYRVGEVSSSGSRATANLTSRKPRYESGLLLQEEGNGWKIAYPPAVLEQVSGPPGVPLGKDEPGQ